MNLQQIVSSPMTRCRETADAFAKASALPCTIDRAVTEIPTPEGIEDRITWLRGVMSSVWTEAPALVQDWRSRLIDTVAGLPEGTVVFTHFVAINAIVGALCNEEQVTVFRPNYCSCTVLRQNKDTLEVIQRGESLPTKVL